MTAAAATRRPMDGLEAGLWQEHRDFVVDMVWFDVLQTVASCHCGYKVTAGGLLCRVEEDVQIFIRIEVLRQIK